jgi:hypothetical protein
MTLFISIVLGFALMFPLGWLFGIMNWPVFHGWGLVHGAFMVAWPALALVSWVLVSLMRTRGKSKHQPSD